MNVKDLIAVLSPKTLARIAHELAQFDDTDPPYDPYHQWLDEVMTSGTADVHAFFGHLDELNHPPVLKTFVPRPGPSEARLSLVEYHTSHHVQLALLKFGDDYYYSMIAAMMLLSDTFNAERFRACWPRVWADYVVRKETPGGFLPEEAC